MRSLIRCMRHTGLSIANAVRLERSQIRQDAQKRFARIITSRSKTSVEVPVPIPSDGAAELLAVANGNARTSFHTGIPFSP